MEWLVAYPQNTPPLLIKVSDPTCTAWLPSTDDEDYHVSYNKKADKWLVSSPSIGMSKYATWCSNHILFTLIFIYHALTQ